MWLHSVVAVLGAVAGFSRARKVRGVRDAAVRRLFGDVGLARGCARNGTRDLAHPKQESHHLIKEPMKCASTPPNTHTYELHDVVRRGHPCCLKTGRRNINWRLRPVAHCTLGRGLRKGCFLNHSLNVLHCFTVASDLLLRFAWGAPVQMATMRPPPSSVRPLLAFRKRPKSAVQKWCSADV